MDKKILIPCFLLAMISLVLLVSASMIPTSSTSGNKISYNVELQIQQGWNLVVLSPIWGDDAGSIDSTSEIQKGDILAAYYYSRGENKYLQLFPSESEVDNYLTTAQQVPSEALYFAQSPVWIYSSKAGTIKYTRKDFPKYDSSAKVTLSNGWNFITITPDMEGKTFEEVQGNCNVEKAYLYYSEAGNWRSVERNRDLFGSQNFLDTGHGMLIKVASSCQMGAGSSVNPPIMP